MDLGEFDPQPLVDQFWTFLTETWDALFVPGLTFLVDLVISNADDIAYLCGVLGLTIAARSWMRRSRA